MTEQTRPSPSSPPLPRRYVLGAVLCGGAVAAAAALGYLGAGALPATESFRFSRGTAFAPGEEDRLRVFLADRASDARIGFRISGHTGTAGDAEANLELSNQRAEAARLIAGELGIPEDRLLFVGGFGGTAPPPGTDDSREAQRAMARVTVGAVRLP
ncbi:MAG: OmpA family protein [Pseudomonadota bacterium]